MCLAFSPSLRRSRPLLPGVLSRERNLRTCETVQYGSCCRTSDKWHPVLLLGDAGCGAAVLFLPACRKSTFGYRARQAELGFVSCLLRSTLFLAHFFFFFFVIPKQAVKLFSPASGAGPGCSRARIGQWSGQGHVLVVQSCLWSPAGDQDSETRGVQLSFACEASPV